ncbi:unnamed protein product, partial [Rotaria socialis]
MKKKKITPNDADEPNSLDEYELTDDTTSQAVSINELTQCSTSSITIGHSVGEPVYEMFEKFQQLVLPADVLTLEELEEITQRACLHLGDGTIMLKPGLRLDFDRFMRALHATNNQNCNQETTANLNDAFFSFFKKLIKSFHFGENDDTKNSHSFLLVFIENIFSNLSKNNNNYRYSEHVQLFAQSLHIFDGRNAYEFVRLNLLGAIPDLSTLDDSLGKTGTCIEEGIFRYNILQNHQKSVGYDIAVCSEDA